MSSAVTHRFRLFSDAQLPLGGDEACAFQCKEFASSQEKLTEPFEGRCDPKEGCVCCAWFVRFLSKERWCPETRGCRLWCKKKAKNRGYDMREASCDGTRCICKLYKKRFFPLPLNFGGNFFCPTNETMTTFEGPQLG